MSYPEDEGSRWEPNGWVDDWTWRQHVAHWIHQLAFRFAAPEEHLLIVKDPDGGEFFSVGFEGGFVAAHPVDSGYTVWCRHGDDDPVEL